MTEDSRLPNPGFTPTSLASFIAIVRSDLRDPREKRLTAAMLWVAGVCGILATIPTNYRLLFLCTSVLLVAVVAGTAIVQFQALDKSQSTLDLGHLLGFLNYNRAKAGLDAVVGQEILTVLENEARVWEQIESGLQSEMWRSREDLRARIQFRADRAMAELVSLGTAAASGTEYLSWHQGWDDNVAILRRLLLAMRQAERVLFIYPRVTDLSSEAPTPVLPELIKLEQILQ